MSDFTRYEVSHGASSAEVAKRLDADGLVVFRNWEPGQILAMFRAVARVVPHRDSDGADMVTMLTPQSDAEGVAGRAGFTHDYMPPHTDGSALTTPPDLIGVACVQSAAVGGDAILVDGQEVVGHLAAQHHPDVLEALATPGTARFGSDEWSSILTLTDDGRTGGIRYREDGLADYSRLATAQLIFSATVTAHIKRLLLAVGDGYILANARWMHGRTAFTGRREMHRLLGYIDGSPATGVRIRLGFDLNPNDVAPQIAS